MAALSDYNVGATIGRGQSAIVKLGERISVEHSGRSRKVAMKMLDKSKLDQMKTQREISNQLILGHEHVVKLEAVFETEDAVCLVMEYAPGGDLFDYIVRHDRLKEDEGRRIFRQLIAGVRHCHEKLVVHRDLKPENIMMDCDFNIKIADFGLSSKFLPGELLTESCGSPNYAAPELLSKGCAYEGPEVDIWSCGVVLYTLLCGCLPFDDETMPGLFDKIKNGRFSIPGYLSDEAKDLMSRMLTVDRAARITTAEIQEHPWFKDTLKIVDAIQPADAASCQTLLVDESIKPSLPEGPREARAIVAKAADGSTKAIAAKCRQLAESASQQSFFCDRAPRRRKGHRSGRHCHSSQRLSTPNRVLSWPHSNRA